MVAKIACAVVCLAAASIAQAEDAGAIYRRYEDRRAVVTDLFVKALAQFEHREQIAAMLEACDKEGMATAVGVSGDERATFLSHEVSNMRGGTDRNAKTIEALSQEERFVLVAQASDQALTYGIGFKEALEMFKKVLPGMCEAAVNEGDKIMQERAKK